MAAPLRDDALLRDVPELEGFKVLDPAVLLSRLGRGGMGAVYRGRHLNLDIDVAVKCLRPELAEDGAQFRVRFEREAKLAANLSHPNLVRVFDVRSAHGITYLVMDLVHGENARERVARKGPLAQAEAMALVLGAARGLAEAHAAGIVHRDIKPDNVMISVDGRVKVTDLGLAKARESQEGLQLTRNNLGTPQYMPPEQWEDTASVGPAGDVWALGATLWFLLTGAEAIQGKSTAEISRRILGEAFPDIRKQQREVMPALAKLIAKATARKATARFADAGAMAEALAKLLPEAATSLADDEAGAQRNQATLNSPPPPQTLLRIKLALGTARTVRQEVPELGEDIPKTVVQARPAWPWRRLVFGLALAVLLGALALVAWQWDSWFPGTPGGPPAAPPRLDWIVPIGVASPIDPETSLPLAVTDRFTGIEFRLIVPGNFAMGSAQDDGGPDEHPRHRVRITRPFYLSRCEVTVGQWRKFVTATRYRAPMANQPPEKGSGTWQDPLPGKEFQQTDNHPVTCVSWLDATAFCKTNGFRLPTEAEWEYACRAGSTGRYPWGDALEGGRGQANVNPNSALVQLTSGANFPFDDGFPYTAPVGTFAANGMGLCDMIGNVLEWCADAYGPSVYAILGRTNPVVTEGADRVARGGSYASSPEPARAARRSHYKPGTLANHIGFRVARNP